MSRPGKVSSGAYLVDCKKGERIREKDDISRPLGISMARLSTTIIATFISGFGTITPCKVEHIDSQEQLPKQARREQSLLECKVA